MMVKVEIEIPEEMKKYVNIVDDGYVLRRNAMLLFPYVQDGTMSHGRAAELLGMKKLDLIALYGKMGLPYFDETREELEEEISALSKIEVGA